MAYELRDLVVDRVDIVDEGANSVAFIELYKRKETNDSMTVEEIMGGLKPEHAETIKAAIAAKDTDLAKAKDDLATASQKLADKDTELAGVNAELAKAKSEISVLKADKCECGGEIGEDGMCKACGKKIKKSVSDEDLLKSMPEPAKELFLKMRAQKEAAEEQVRKDAAEKAEKEAVAKAATLKAIPVAADKLVGVVKSCTPEVLEVLKAANDAIETAVLGEVGKNKGNGADTGANSGSDAAWDQIEKRAAEIATRDNITKEKAVSKVLAENPELYKQYLNGGAN